ncbi:MAG: twin-arginine translocase subunit TatC [Deltaproteobacteria bacterium]|jgi:sec-independent protein translocase protein TatC|nr:twin-arginine translocase subunit TatC [Deltaproteobacteria bacterium]
MTEVNFLSHLKELRFRLIVCLSAFVVASLGAWPFRDQTLAFLMTPVLDLLPPGESLKFFALQDAFSLNFKVSIWAGLIFSSPITLYQIWAFCAPALKPSEKKKVPLLALLALSLLLAGVCFAYFLVWPITFNFFLGFSSSSIRPLLAGDRYLSLIIGLTVAFALAFQLPLILMFLGRLGLITAQTLKKYRPYAIIAFFVIGAILTPPDVLSQCCLALTLWFLYELSALLLPRKPVDPELEQLEQINPYEGQSEDPSKDQLAKRLENGHQDPLADKLEKNRPTSPPTNAPAEPGAPA